MLQHQDKLSIRRKRDQINYFRIIPNHLLFEDCNYVLKYFIGNTNHQLRKTQVIARSWILWSFLKPGYIN